MTTKKSYGIMPAMSYRNPVELAKAIGYSKQSIYNLLESGRIKGEKVNGRYWIITNSEFDRIVKFYKERVKSGYKLPFFPAKWTKKRKRA